MIEISNTTAAPARAGWLGTAGSALNLFVGGAASLKVYAIAAALGAALLGGAVLWHGYQVAAVKAEAFKAGQADVQARWDVARQQAQAEQDKRTSAAESALVEEVEVVRTVYRDRIKEVTKYVPAPGSQCPADPEFVRLFNATAAAR
jgi:hypothetical protein